MVYEILRKQMQAALPFNNLVGIEIAEIGDGTGRAHLPMRPELQNHIGTAHASAIFSLAEATSGAAMSGAFAPMILAIRPLAKEVSIAYMKTTKSDLTATANVDADPTDLLASLKADGRVAFAVRIKVQDADGNTISEATVDWDVRDKG